MPKATSSYVELFRAPQGGHPISLIVLNPAAEITVTHFDKKAERSDPCTADKGPCQGCKDGMRQAWVCYLGCWDKRRCRRCLLELPRGAHDNNAVLQSGANLRGMTVSAWRLGDARNAPVKVAFEGMRPGVILPAPFDLQPAIYRIWGLVHDSEVIIHTGEAPNGS